MSLHSCVPRLSRREVLVAGLAFGAATATGFAIPSPTVHAAATGGRYIPITPTRVADTRQSGGYTRTGPNQITVPVVGRAGVISGDIAVAAIITAHPTSSGGGFITVWPTDTPSRPTVSTVNHTGAVVSNLTLVKLGADGKINLYHHNPGCAFTVDVIGRFTPTVTATSGRYQPIPPARPVDTRRVGAPFTIGETRQMTVAANGVPADAVAVAVNITAANPTTVGTWTVWPSGDRPDVANLHVAGANRAAAAIIPTNNLTVNAHTTCGGHLIIDIVGYFTGPTAANTTDGLFTPCAPTRILDTRNASQPIPAGMSREADIAGTACSVFAANITAVAPTAAGYGAVWAGGEQRPGTSTLNWPAGSGPIPNFAFVRAGTRGVAVAPNVTAHMLVDITGWFTGTRSTGTVPPVGWQPHGIAGINMEAHTDEWFDYGTSTQGRPLRGYRYGAGPRKALLITGIHGNEHSGTSILADLVTRGRIPGWTLMIVPVANPDARAANVRYLGTDMNRDFESGWTKANYPHLSSCVTTQTGSTPLTLHESRQLKQAVTVGPFAGVELSISHHDNYNWVAPQIGSRSALRTLCTEYATATGLRRPGEGASYPKSVTWADVPGGFERYMHSLGAKSVLVENKAGYTPHGVCNSPFGIQPSAADVAPHYQALRAMLLDARLPN